MYNTNNMGMGMGVIPNPAVQPKVSNWLNGETISKLQKGLGTFKLSVTEEELARGQCNHYNPDGSSALIPDSDGTGGCRCAICNTHFNTAEYSKNDVENATNNMLDILNTIKIMYWSIDPAAAREYFQIIPFLEKVPDLFEIAANDFKKYEGVNAFNPAQGPNAMNIWNMMTSGYPMGMPNPGYGYAQQPMNPGYGYAQPAAAPGYGYAQQPVAPGYGYAQQPVAPAYNPIYGGQQAPVQQSQQPAGYQPQQQGYTFQPMGAAAQSQQAMVNTNMPVQPTTNTAPAPAAPTTNEVKVDTQFKK